MVCSLWSHVMCCQTAVGSLAAHSDSIISQLSLALKVTDRPTQTTLYRSRKAPVIYTGGSRLPGAVQLSSAAGQSQTTGQETSSCSMAQLLGPSSSAGRQETTGRWTPAQITVIIDPSSVPSSFSVTDSQVVFRDFHRKYN